MCRNWAMASSQSASLMTFDDDGREENMQSDYRANIVAHDSFERPLDHGGDSQRRIAGSGGPRYEGTVEHVEALVAPHSTL
ncbi:hypothetical protein A5662_12090 [Mycobacteriaceae bacterium 1482268.1]|nr:hypothetical protein A5662_12090 [Mycobacteriaceae bacterium 1482268.1]